MAIFLVAACTTDPTDPTDPGTGSGSGSGSGSGDPDPTAAFTIVSKDVTLQPNQEVTYCYYFHTPNTEQLVIKDWVSDMTPGSHHMIMYWGTNNQPADGTLDPSGNCSGGGVVPLWIYATQTPHAEVHLPQDDGTGKPLGMTVPPNQPGYFQMHYLNQSDEPLVVNVRVAAHAYAPNTAFTPTAAFITYNADINIAPNASNYAETETCTVPANAKFWSLSSHSHKQSIKTMIEDGSSMVFLSEGPDAWEHPGAKKWDMAPYYQFATGQLKYTCVYNNPSTRTILDGGSAQFDEMCMATSYIFPATQAKFCLTNLGPL